MSDELRAAATRLKESAEAWLGSTDPDDRDADDTAHWRDELAVAAAYLAEHPADDGEPVTADWLRTLGFACDAGVFHLTHETDTDGEWFLNLSYFGWGACLTRDGATLQIPLPTTRGAVRRLLASLGCST